MFSKVNGGLEQVFLNFIPALESQGNEVISIIHPQAAIRASCPAKNLITVHNFNQHDWLAVFRLKRLISQYRPDCIITHSYRAAYLFAKTRTKVPTVAICHVKGHYDFGTRAIIALTEQMRQDIIQAGIPANQVHRVPNLITLPAEPPVYRADSQRVPVIGVCARLAEIKGVDVFIRALAILKQRGIDFQARIAGDGEQRDLCQQLITEGQLGAQVELLGWVDDRDPFYQSLDIFCLPSREEAFGLVILESMKHGLPMVLSRLSGPLEIIGDSDCALLAEANNPTSLADQLQTLIGDADRRRALATKAWHRVQAYGSQQIAPLLHQTLETICTPN